VSKTIDVLVPDIGDFHDVPVIEVLVSPGASIKRDDPIVILESDKASMDVPAPQAARVPVQQASQSVTWTQRPSWQESTVQGSPSSHAAASEPGLVIDAPGSLVGGDHELQFELVGLPG